MNSTQNDLLIAEYNALRAENLQRIDQLATQSRHILVITGGIWAWLLTELTVVTTLAYWIPLAIAVLFFANYYLTIKTIRRVSAYLKHVTAYVELPAGLGWEQYLQTHPLGHMSKWGWIFWCIVIMVNGVLPVYLLFLR